MNTGMRNPPGGTRAVKSRISLLIVMSAALVLVPVTPRLLAQDLGAATRPLPDLRVLLMWGADTLSGSPVKYNIFRKPAASAAYPVMPLNTSPIGPITDTVQFKTVIPRGSDDWNFISYALADSMGGRNPVQPLANVFAITSFTPGSRKWQRVQMLVAVRPTVALVMGQAFTDLSVTNGTAYKYKIFRVNSGGTQLPSTGANEVTITAGVPNAIPVPSGVHIVIGDAKLQIIWTKPLPQFSGFNVYRSGNPIGPYRPVNDVDYSADVSRDIDSVAVSPAANGFTDYEHWDTTGNPLPRSVPGNPLPFTGPANGVPYWYKVAHKDILGNVGTLSAQVAGTALDRTPPATPGDIFVEAVESNSSFRVRWTKVRLDIDGHRENVVSYNVYRYAHPDNPSLGAVAVPPATLQPGPLDSTILVKDDSTMGLRSACLDSTLYFRVEAVDAAGNISRRSIAVGAALKDTTRPAAVRGTKAEGYDDYIRVKWQLNTDCGIDAYLIYRSLCDRGKWYPCPPAYTKGRLTDQPAAASNDKRKGDCGGPFVLVGVVPQSLAKTLGGGSGYFDDHSVPAGSPLCYAYIVKAQDHSQNIGGTLPIPAVPPEIIVCQRLRDRTPPEPAIIAGLFARDSAIQIDYIGPPVQDIAAYHIYRSDSSQFGTYRWVGGMTVVPPPGVGMPLAAPYVPPPQVACDSIPLVSNPYMSAGTFFDRNVDRKHIYWYKVLGIDRSGNQSLPDSALAISTFTFASGRETPPQIVSVTATDNPCALTLNWSPAYDTTRVRGFLVFRSRSPFGQYLQLEGLQRSNAYADPSVIRGTTYFYRVVALRRDGILTSMSDPKSGAHP